MKETEAKAIQKFVVDLAMHFSPPKHGTPEAEKAWLTSVTDALKGHAPEVLERATRHIIATRKYRTFPLVAECREAGVRAAEEIEFEKHLQTLPSLRQSVGAGWSKERSDMANQLIKSGMGRQASQDNPCWVLSLWNFCQRFQRLPDNRPYEARTPKEKQDFAGCSEIEFCKRSARDFDEAYDRCLRGEAGPMSPELEKLGDSMVAKREKLRAEALAR